MLYIMIKLLMYKGLIMIIDICIKYGFCEKDI